MRSSFRSIVAQITILTLALMIFPVSAMDSTGGATLEGLLVDVDGTPAAGYRVHLIDDTGTPLAQATADEDGLYSFSGVPTGEYALGIENDRGQLAPVAAPPMRLGENELARRDLKLLASDGPGTEGAMRGNYSAGTWWAGLSPAGKTWMVVAIVVAAGLIWAALDDDDDDDASVFEPPVEEQ